MLIYGIFTARNHQEGRHETIPMNGHWSLEVEINVRIVHPVPCDPMAYLSFRGGMYYASSEVDTVKYFQFPKKVLLIAENIGLCG